MKNGVFNGRASTYSINIRAITTHTRDKRIHAGIRIYADIRTHTHAHTRDAIFCDTRCEM